MNDNDKFEHLMQHGWDTAKVHNHLMMHINYVTGEDINDFNQHEVVGKVIRVKFYKSSDDIL